MNLTLHDQIGFARFMMEWTMRKIAHHDEDNASNEQRLEDRLALARWIARLDSVLEEQDAYEKALESYGEDT